VKGVQQGEIVSDENVRSIRPADGLPPAFFSEIRGRAFRAAIAAGTPLRREMLS
jgi:N-acetylneuraminate synthase